MLNIVVAGSAACCRDFRVRYKNHKMQGDAITSDF